MLIGAVRTLPSGNASNPGQIVFDPFTGSGTTLTVAHRLGRRWLGTELSPDYAAKALQRVLTGDASNPDKPKPRGPRRRNAAAVEPTVDKQNAGTLAVGNSDQLFA